MEEVTRVRGVLQHPQDHLLREDSCWFDLPGREGCDNEMWAGQCYTILMAFQLIFTRMVEMGLVERMAEGGCFGDSWDKINSFVQEGCDCSYLVRPRR